MELDTGSRMYMRVAALLNSPPGHPGPYNPFENDAGRGGTNGNVTASSVRAGNRSPHPGAVPANGVAIGKSGMAPKESAYLIEIFGMSAGVLVMDGTRFVFRAAHRAFWELDESRFSSAAHAERAVYSSWTRFQHRSRPGIRSGRP